MRSPAAVVRSCLPRPRMSSTSSDRPCRRRCRSSHARTLAGSGSGTTSTSTSPATRAAVDGTASDAMAASPPSDALTTATGARSLRIMAETSSATLHSVTAVPELSPCPPQVVSDRTKPCGGQDRSDGPPHRSTLAASMEEKHRRPGAHRRAAEHGVTPDQAQVGHRSSKRAARSSSENRPRRTARWVIARPSPRYLERPR